MSLILKSRFYVCRREDKHYDVLPRAFKTDSAAYDSMMERDSDAYDPSRPSWIPMRRKAEYVGCTTVKGKRILERPNLFRRCE